MTIGDSGSTLSRLKSLLPPNWFAFVAPVRDAVLGGFADSAAWNYTLLAVARAQSRLATATGYFLDIASYDFLGLGFLRRKNESDNAYRARIVPEIFRPRVTIPAIIQALTDLTGEVPLVFEPFNPGGGYRAGGLAYGGGLQAPPAINGGYGARRSGYGMPGSSYGLPSAPRANNPGVGFYGSLSYPFQIFVTAYRSRSSGIPNVIGYGTGGGGYGIRGLFVYSSINQAKNGTVSDADIYACVARTVAAGITAWVAIVDVSGNPVVPVIPANLDWSVPGNVTEIFA